MLKVIRKPTINKLRVIRNVAMFAGKAADGRLNDKGEVCSFMPCYMR
jgi:hypothetical protein